MGIALGSIILKASAVGAVTIVAYLLGGEQERQHNKHDVKCAEVSKYEEGKEVGYKEGYADAILTLMQGGNKHGENN